MKSLKTAFDKDNLWTTLLRQLTGFVSDGAAVMTGSIKGVAKQLSDEKTRLFGVGIFSLHCMAHRLELAYGDAVTALTKSESDGEPLEVRAPYLLTLEDTISSAYDIYRMRYKNRGQLKALAASMDMQMYSFKYIQKTRWMQSKFGCVYNLYKNFDIMAVDLQEFEAPVKPTKHELKQLELKESILNIRYPFVISFHLDLLGELKELSMEMQSTDFSLFDFVPLIERKRSAIERLRTRDGSYLRSMKQSTQLLI
jgi:hypothetical protein